MKVVNDLHRTTLITGAEAQKVLSKSENLDLNRLRSNIIVAEERFLRNILGDDFYDALVASKNTEVITANKDTLQNDIRAEWNKNDFVLNVGDIVNDESFLSADNKKLWRNHLWQIAAECVFFVAYPDNLTDMTSQGVVHKSPKLDAIAGGGSYTPELATVKFQMDKMITGRIAPLIESMHRFLCKNKDKYPLYEKDCKCDAAGNKYSGSGPTFINMYNDEEEEDCGCED